MAKANLSNLRNQKCTCGSGRKYKNCCMAKEKAKSQVLATWASILLVVLMVAGVVGFFGGLLGGGSSSSDGGSASPGAGKVWSEEHGHYH